MILLVGPLLPVNTLRAGATDNTLLILDASGSMWGRVEGRTKIETARDVIVELLDSSSTQQSLGLMSYGHRRKGDCSDIELLVEPSRNTNSAIQSAVKSIKPRGKTPLSASVIEAARTLRHESARATVILVSDGRETCGYDPCLVAKELEQAGIDFTAHVIGFNVTDPLDLSQLQCMAENTGGQFVAAGNGEELSRALQSVSDVFDRFEGELTGDTGNVDSNGDVTSSNADAPQVAEETTEIYIEPLSRQSKARESQAVLADREVVASTTRDTPATNAPGTNAPGANAPGTNAPGRDNSGLALDSITGDASDGNAREQSDEAVSTEQVVEDKFSNPNATVVTELPASGVAVVVPVELAVPPVLYTSQVFSIRWSGSGSAVDLITIATPDLPAEQWIQAVAAGSGKVKLTAPEQPGEYEVRYVSADRQIYASFAVTVRRAEATLIAPAEARSGRLVRIRWKGGTNDPKDSIVITRNGAPMSSAINRRVIRAETSVMLLMPSRPGDYELRYMQAGGNAIDSQSIIVR